MILSVTVKGWKIIICNTYITGAFTSKNNFKIKCKKEWEKDKRGRNENNLQQPIWTLHDLKYWSVRINAHVKGKY